MGQWTHGAVNTWGSGHMGQWTYGAVDTWDSEHMGQWTYGAVVTWDSGHVGQWAYLGDTSVFVIQFVAHWLFQIVWYV